MISSNAWVVLSAIAFLAGSAEGAPEARLDGQFLIVGASTGSGARIALPCPASAVEVEGRRIYVACGDEGVAVVGDVDSGHPRLLFVRDLGGRVVGFHRVRGQLWAEVQRSEARLLSDSAAGTSGLSAPPAAMPSSPVPIAPPPADGAASAPVASATTPPQAADASGSGRDTTKPSAGASLSQTSPAAVSGRVVEMRPTSVVVDLGRRHGLSEGGRVALYLEERVTFDNGAEAATRTEVVAIGTLRAVSESWSEVELGRNETVPASARAKPTTEPISASAFAPPRAAGVWSFSFNARPFLALDSFGVGAVTDAAVGLRLDAPLHLQALLEPLGFGIADSGNVIASAGNLIASYDTRFFEVGLGAGWSAVNNDIESKLEFGMADSVAGALPVQFDNVRSGLSLAQLARLGAQDGLHLAVRNTFLLYEKVFHYGGTVGELLVPVSGRTWLLGRGGSGAAGFGYGELGLRLLLWGNGHRDSFFVSGTLGGAGVWGEKEATCPPYRTPDKSGKCYESVEYGGPMVGMGLEWRR